MINPGERFDAFSSNRLNKRDSGTGYQLSSNYIIGPKTHALFTFFHLLNRTVTSIPWIFYLSIFLANIQLIACELEPWNYGIWQGKYPELEIFLKICTIIVRYVPHNTSPTAEYIVFAIASVLTVSHLLLFIIIIMRLKSQKNASRYISVFFFYSFLVYPIFRSSFLCVSTRYMKSIVENPSVGTFFLSALALVIVIIQFIMSIIVAVACGSSPAPNIMNPMSVWAPNSWDSGVYFFMLNLCFVVVELECNAKGLVISILLCARCVGFLLTASFHAFNIYYVSFTAYQFITAIYMSFNMFEVVTITLSFKPGIIPYWIIILYFVMLPIVFFIILKVYTHVKVNKLMKKLKQAPKTEMSSGQSRAAEEGALLEAYSDLNLGKSDEALFAVRASCVLGLDCFADGSLLKYVLHTYDDLFFQMLYMSFLIPDNLNFLKQLIDSFLARRTPKFLEAAIIFQLVTSIQESSNELCSSISHEISKQTLAGFKCEQILAKFWAGCYKGDISQMSRSTFTLYQNLYELSESWRQLVIRYPYSLPTLKEYIKFLNGVGRQHRVAESILKVHPKLSDNVSSTSPNNMNDVEVNISILHQSIEDAVDRRPLSSLYHAKIRLLIAVILTFLFIIAAIVLAFVFIKISKNMGSYLYYSDTACTLVVHTPNLYEKIVMNETDARDQFFNHSKVLDTSITNLLLVMPEKILRNSSNLSLPLYVRVNEYNTSESVGIVKFMRLYSYFCRSVPFVPINDTLVQLMKKNTYGVGYSVFLASDVELYQIINLITQLQRYIPIYYGVTWGIMIIIMIPLIYNALQNVKTELKYIFNLYLTIPRSVITEFMEPDNKQDGPHRITSQQYLNQNISNGEDSKENQGMFMKDYRAVDNLKLLVHDKSATSSVIPKNFQLKVWFIIGSISFLLLIASTIEVILFTRFVGEMMLEFRTLQMTARRTIGCAIALQGILSNWTTYSYAYGLNRLNMAKDFNNQLLIAMANGNISQKLLTSTGYYNIVHNHPCTDDEDIGCWPLDHIFDYFMILATKAYNSSIPDEELNDMTELYNDYLYPMSFKLHETAYNFISDQFKEMQITLLLIFFLIVGFVTFTGFIFLKPIIRQLDSAIEAVKLPLKYIPPIKVPDLPKIMQYLQGEADWHHDKQGSETTESRFGNYLSILEYPHAIFEADKSLLFANPTFYNLIGAPREACIGLTAEAIFSRLINFAADPKHPFNQVIEYMNDTEQHTCLKLTTQFERGAHKSKNVELHLSKVESEDSKFVFVMSFDDLTEHDHYEEMTRYQRQLAENVKHSAIPLQLYNALSVDGVLKERRFERAPMVSFSISYATLRDEYDGELADGCSLFLKSSKEVSGVFPNIAKLIHEPPSFVFLYIPDESESIDVSAIQMVHFINAVINSFHSSTQMFKISCMMLVGEIIVIPMKTKLPVMEAFGAGYKVLIQTRMKIKSSGKFYVTKDTAALLTDQHSVTLNDDKENGLVVVTQKHVDD